MLPWLRDRPLTLVRAPDGVGQHRYFQKDTPRYAPDWIRTVSIHAESAKRTVRYVLCNDRRTLAWLGNQAAVEFHPSPVRVQRLDRPDLLIFDLDPPRDRYPAVVDVAMVLHEILEELHLPSWDELPTSRRPSSGSRTVANASSWTSGAMHHRRPPSRRTRRGRSRKRRYRFRSRGPTSQVPGSPTSGLETCRSCWTSPARAPGASSSPGGRGCPRRSPRAEGPSPRAHADRITLGAAGGYEHGVQELALPRR
jgi:hypothetical protein